MYVRYSFAFLSKPYAEMKPTQDHEQMNSIPKYLAKLFSFNSSTELVPNSNDGESTELPNSSSLGIDVILFLFFLKAINVRK